MLKRTTPYAVELDGAILRHDAGRLHHLTHLSDIRGECRVVTDFQDSIARTMTVEADTRYIELMISRKLQEAGEFDEPVTIITHWKKKRGKNLSDIFFTALPAKRYLQYVELVAQHKDHLLVLPLQSLIYSMIKKYGRDYPVAAVLQHGRFADVLIGSREKILHAGRVVAYDDSEEQINAMWETVRGDIESTGQEHRQNVDNVYVATWVDSGPLPRWSADDDPRIIPLKDSMAMQDGQEVHVSLPSMIDRTWAGQAVASTADKFFFGARRMLPAFNVVLVLAALLMGGWGLWCQMEANGRQERIETAYRQMKEIRANVPESIEPVPFEKNLAFVQRLWVSRKLPTYRQILADVGQGENGTLRLENIKADYSEDKVLIKAYGTAHAPFETAYKAYQALRQRLTDRGYRMLEDRFDTRINASNFVMQFVKELR